MADQNSPQGRRPHFHRGRRGPDRRGSDRRTPPHSQEAQPARDHVDVEQIVRDIRSRISQRHGIELSNQQIQELAARRLEAILEPRNVKPALLEQLRRSAAEPLDVPPVAADGGFTFEETALYDGNGGFLRAIRRLLNPILKLFFNPKPIAQALGAQAQINKDAAARDAARDRTQAEWNALHYEILQRLVTEVARVSIEMQSLSLRMESLGTKVDFNERRVRAFEQTSHPGRPAPARSVDATVSQAPVTADTATAESGGPTAAGEGTSEGSRRRRRRRRGRRGGGGAAEGTTGVAAVDATGSAQDAEDLEGGDEAEGPDVDTAIDDASSMEPPTPAPAAASEPDMHAAAPQPALPTQPAPPRDEPLPPAPVDHADPGPTDR